MRFVPPCPSAAPGAQGIPARASAGSLPPGKAFGQGATSPANETVFFMVPVLFTEKNSVYNNLLGTDPWNEQRNALTFTGDHAIIAHPPCRLFSRLRTFSTAPAEEKQLAFFALQVIRKNGGILEHPASSSLWKDANLPKGKDTDEYGGFTLSIDQFWFGHPCEKKTWLYIVGIQRKELPVYPLKFSAVQFCISKPGRNSNLKELPKALRNHTPTNFARYLINLAILIESKKNTNSFIHS